VSLRSVQLFRFDSEGRFIGNDDLPVGNRFATLWLLGISVCCQVDLGEF